MEHTTCDDQRPWMGRGRSQAWSRSACPSLRGRAVRFRAGGSSRPRGGRRRLGTGSGREQPPGTQAGPSLPACRESSSGGPAARGRWFTSGWASAARAGRSMGLRLRVSASASGGSRLRRIRPCNPARGLFYTGSAASRPEAGARCCGSDCAFSGGRRTQRNWIQLNGKGIEYSVYSDFA